MMRKVAPALSRGRIHEGARVADLTAIGAQHAEHDPHQRGLSRAVRAEQPGRATRGDLDVDGVERSPLTEGERDVTDPQRHTPTLTAQQQARRGTVQWDESQLSRCLPTA